MLKELQITEALTLPLSVVREPFYASISIASPDLNYTVEYSVRKHIDSGYASRYCNNMS